MNRRTSWRKKLDRVLAFLKNNAVLVGIFAVAVLVRAWAFGDIPSGLNQDEASTAYDAFALLHYGVDRNGFALPLFLVAWGSSMQALPAYLAMPFMAIFGTTIVAARLASLLLGITSVWFLYALIRNIIDRPTAQLAALLLAISPGHIMLSRWAHEACYFPGFFLAGTLLLALSFRNPKMLYVSAVVLGLSMYTYAPAYLVVPVFLAVIALYAAIHRLWSWKIYLHVGLILLVMALPLMSFLAINAFDLPSVVTPFFSIPNLPTAPRYESMANLPFLNPNFFSTSWDNLRNGFQLLQSQNDGLIWNSIPEYGVVYLFSLPLILLGFALLVQRSCKKRFEPTFILLAWIAACVVLVAFSSVNINRANIAIIPLIFCAAIGVNFFRKYPFVFWPIMALYALSFIQFTHAYFGTYREQVAPAFFSTFDQALREAAENTGGRICVTGQVNMPYIFALFYNREDPRTFLQTVDYYNPGAEFQAARSFGRYTFGLESCTGNDYGAYVLHRDERNQFTNGNYLLHDYAYYSVAYPIQR